MKRRLPLLALALAMAACVTQQNPDPSFTLSLSAADSSPTLVQGTKRDLSVAIGRQSGFGEAVSLSLEKKGGGSLATGLSYSFSPKTASGSGSTLTLEASTGTAPGVYDLQVTGSAGKATQYAYLTLTVQEKPQPGSFSLTVNPSSRSLERPASGSVNASAEVSIVRDKFSEAVSLSLEQADGKPLPTGISAGFSPASATGGSSTLTLTVSAQAQAGSYSLRVKGTAGSTTKYAPFTLSVTAPATPPPPPPPPPGGANPTLLRSYMWVQNSPEGDQPAVEAMFYRPRQFKSGVTIPDEQNHGAINDAGAYQGWDVLTPPNGGKHGGVWQYDKPVFVRLTLSRDARLAVVWRADPAKVPNWLKNNWSEQGKVRIAGQDRRVFVKNFSAGQAVELGSVYDPGQRQAQNLETYWVLFAEKDGTPPAEPPQLGSPAAEPNKACPQWVHDQYTTEVTMPNGARRVLATWHPQVDPVYWCYFGHDHGSDPGLFKAGYKPAFGYIQDALHTDGVLPEPHPGFKNYVWERDGYRWLFVHHFGTGGAGRVCRQFHSLEVAVASASTGEIVAKLHINTDFGPSTNNNTDLPLEATCPQGVLTPSQVADQSNGERKIHVYDGTQGSLNGYEPWRSDVSGNILGLNLGGLTFDTVNPITACTGPVCSSLMRIGNSTGETRLFSFATDPGGPALSIDASRTPGGGGEFFTDVYGKKVLPASDPGAVRQYVKPGLRLEVRNPQHTECFTRDAFFMFYEGCDLAANVPQAFMNIEGALTDKN
ncbi:hypothetical protein [Calidithermus chliarophilus]|uniref:COG1470 family protein n=1 Tax=Calidithermus chliarophilus TaxID=52023 RepID=UPI000429A456|nr:hypothetical protein [Calidithermus chliarophilus]